MAYEWKPGTKFPVGQPSYFVVVAVDGPPTVPSSAYPTTINPDQPVFGQRANGNYYLELLNTSYGVNYDTSTGARTGFMRIIVYDAYDNMIAYKDVAVNFI